MNLYVTRKYVYLATLTYLEIHSCIVYRLIQPTSFQIFVHIVRLRRKSSSDVFSSTRVANWSLLWNSYLENLISRPSHNTVWPNGEPRVSMSRKIFF